MSLITSLPGPCCRPLIRHLNSTITSAAATIHHHHHHQCYLLSSHHHHQHYSTTTKTSSSISSSSTTPQPLPPHLRFKQAKILSQLHSLLNTPPQSQNYLNIHKSLIRNLEGVRNSPRVYHSLRLRVLAHTLQEYQEFHDEIMKYQKQMMASSSTTGNGKNGKSGSTTATTALQQQEMYEIWMEAVNRFQKDYEYGQKMEREGSNANHHANQLQQDQNNNSSRYSRDQHHQRHNNMPQQPPSVSIFDVYADLMTNMQNSRPSPKVLKLIIQESDTDTFLEHAIHNLIQLLKEEKLTEGSQSSSSNSAHSISSISSTLITAIDKVMALNNMNLLKQILSHQFALSLLSTLNYELASRVVSFLCRHQEFSFAIRFIKEMLPKLHSRSIWNAKHSNAPPSTPLLPMNSLLLVLNTAAELGESQVVEDVVREILLVQNSSIENLPHPLNAIVMSAIFKAYLINEEYEQALEALVNLRNCGVQSNTRFILPLAQMLLLSQQENASNVVRELLSVLNSSPDLITQESVSTMIHVSGAVNLHLAYGTFKDFSKRVPRDQQAPLLLALATVYAAPRPDTSTDSADTDLRAFREESVALFKEALQDPESLSMSELEDYCKCFLKDDIHTAFKVFLKMYEVYGEEVSPSLLGLLLKRGMKVSERVYNQLLDAFERHIRSEHVHLFESIVMLTQKNQENKSHRFIVYANGLQYEEPVNLLRESV